MLFLIELDHVKSGQALSPEQARAFIERVILPTLARAQQLITEKKIVAGGPVVGRIALRMILDTSCIQELDRVVRGIPLWPLAKTGSVRQVSHIL